MRRLILLRHARAERPARIDDFDRPLAVQGRADAQIMGAILAREGLRPDRALVSAARRARETWEALEQGLGPNRSDASVEFRRDLYLADAERLLIAAEDEEDADTLMLVAHNPGVHALAVALMRRDGAAPSLVARLERGFPTATAAVFAVDAAGRAQYDGLFLVAEHGGHGRE